MSVKLYNDGNRPEVIRWSESKVNAALVSRSGDASIELGTPIQARPLSIKMGEIGWSTIDPSSSQTIAFLIPIECEGVYFLEAILVGSPIEMSEMIGAASEAGVMTSDVAGWGGTMYFNFSETPETSPNNCVNRSSESGGP